MTANDQQALNDFAFDFDVHYHEAYYRGDKLTRDCGNCGLDLTDEIHIRSEETMAMARLRYAQYFHVKQMSGIAQRSAEKTTLILQEVLGEMGVTYSPTSKVTDRIAAIIEQESERKQ
jgi:hypothetical protein